MITFNCRRYHIPVTFVALILSFSCVIQIPTVMHSLFMTQFSEKGGEPLLDAQKTADNVANLAGSHVLRHLIRPMKLPWERNPVLNPKRAFCHSEPDLGQSVVGMREFALNVGCSGPPVDSAPTPVLNRTLKRAKLAATVLSPDELQLRALSLIQIMVESDRALANLQSKLGRVTLGLHRLVLVLEMHLLGKLLQLFTSVLSHFGIVFMDKIHNWWVRSADN